MKFHHKENDQLNLKLRLCLQNIQYTMKTEKFE